MSSNFQFNVIVEDEEVLSKCDTFIAGYHGLGEVGWLTVRHLIDELKTKRVAIVSSSSAPPFISIENSMIRLPFEIYAYENVAIFIPRLQPYRHTQVEFSEKLSEWVLSRKHFSRCFLIGGVDSRLKSGETDTKYVPTRVWLENELEGETKSDVKKNILDNGLFIAGPLAIILGMMDLKKFPALGILAYAERDLPDLQAAANVIKVLSEKLGFKISVDNLIKNASLIQEEISQQLLIEKQNVQEDKDNKPPTYS
ncbi:MAG: proteasome assembly chaperone family protein [Candidatus Odinarchaeota archaeon]